MSSRWGKLLDLMVEGREPSVPFMEALPLPKRVVKWEAGRLWQEWPVDPRLFHPRGAVFGGFLAALADRSLFLTALTVLEDHEAVTTADLNVSFFRPVTEGTIHIEGEVIHRGKSLVQVEVEFRRDDGKLAVKASASEAIIPTPDRWDSV
ncbi:MAG: PaaI family thioesterase [Candidatus Hydrogenedentes bacterium]|nr:PaaI family thioesterase [Candidatus Hydrogenedentota bacterium]